jgi:SagB-type dehydrogenase family enzyme
METKKEIRLTEPRCKGGVSLEEAIAQRRSVRSYARRSLTLQEVSQLLWSVQGVTAPWGGRTAPSAGGLYPLETYVTISRVADLPQGLYHYDPKRQILRLVRPWEDADREALSEAALGQSCVRDAHAVLIIAAVEARTARKYGQRATRYVHMEVGCACENVHLQCESLGLGTVAVGAFDDRAVGHLLREAPSPLLLMPVGPKQER